MSPASKRILILGANRYNLLSIKAARRAGFQTLVADRNPRAAGFAAADIAIPLDIVDYELLLAAIEKHGGVDGIVSMAEPGVRAAAHLSRRLGLSSITEEAASHATSKAAMRRLWAVAGTYTTDFRVVASEQETIEAARQLQPYPLILKPDRSLGGARGVIRIEQESELRDAFAFAMSGALPGSALVLEKCIAGTEHSAEVLIWKGRTSVLCISQKVKSPPPYRVDVSVQYPAPLTARQEAIVATMCQEAIAALGLTQGAAHVEFAYTDDGPVLFELGARCGGGHTPQIAHHVSGVDEFIEYCRMACGTEPAAFTPLTRRGADFRFLIFPPGRVARVSIPDKVRHDPHILDVDATVQPGEEIKLLRTTGDRAGFIVCTAENLHDAVAVADESCKTIVVQYDNGREARAQIFTSRKGT